MADGPTAPVIPDNDPALKGLQEAMAASEGDAGVDDPLTRPRPPVAEPGGPVPIPDEGPGDEDPGPGPDDTPEEEPEPDRPAPEPPGDTPEELLEPKTLPVERTLVDKKGRSATYVQEGLGFFGKAELYGIFGRAIDSAMSGDNALGVDDLMSAMKPQSLLAAMQADLPGAEDAPDREDLNANQIQEASLAQAGKVLATFARILSFTPDLLKETYCVILNIPKAHRNWALNHGLDSISDEEGEDILHTFIDQNWLVMEDFFRNRLPKIIKRAGQARSRHASAH